MVSKTLLVASVRIGSLFFIDLNCFIKYLVDLIFTFFTTCGLSGTMYPSLNESWRCDLKEELEINAICNKCKTHRTWNHQLHLPLVNRSVSSCHICQLGSQNYLYSWLSSFQGYHNDRIRLSAAVHLITILNIQLMNCKSSQRTNFLLSNYNFYQTSVNALGAGSQQINNIQMWTQVNEDFQFTYERFKSCNIDLRFSRFHCHGRNWFAIFQTKRLSFNDTTKCARSNLNSFKIQFQTLIGYC